MKSPLTAWREATPRRRLIYIAAVAAAAGLIYYLWSRKSITAESGATYTRSDPAVSSPLIAPGDEAPDHLPIDDAGLRRLLNLGPDANINGSALEAFQRQQDIGLTIDGKIGPKTRCVARMFYMPISDIRSLTQDELMVMAKATAQFESGGRFNATNLNGEFDPDDGRWDGHPLEGKASVGLSYGYIQFIQKSSLRHVIRRLYELDPGAWHRHFDVPFGRDAALEAYKMLTGPGGKEEAVYGMADGGLRNLRVRKVRGKDMWEQPWLSAWKAIGVEKAMQQAQLEAGIENYIRPACEMALEYGFCGRPELAIFVDMWTHMGSGAAPALIRKTFDANPVKHRSDIWRLVRAYKSYSVERTNHVRHRRVRVAELHNPTIGYCSASLSHG